MSSTASSSSSSSSLLSLVAFILGPQQQQQQQLQLHQQQQQQQEQELNQHPARMPNLPSLPSASSTLCRSNNNNSNTTMSLLAAPPSSSSSSSSLSSSSTFRIKANPSAATASSPTSITAFTAIPPLSPPCDRQGGCQDGDVDGGEDSSDPYAGDLSTLSSRSRSPATPSLLDSPLSCLDAARNGDDDGSLLLLQSAGGGDSDTSSLFVPSGIPAPLLPNASSFHRADSSSSSVSSVSSTASSQFLYPSIHPHAQQFLLQNAINQSFFHADAAARFHSRHPSLPAFLFDRRASSSSLPATTTTTSSSSGSVGSADQMGPLYPSSSWPQINLPAASTFPMPSAPPLVPTDVAARARAAQSSKPAPVDPLVLVESLEFPSSRRLVSDLVDVLESLSTHFFEAKNPQTAQSVPVTVSRFVTTDIPLLDCLDVSDFAGYGPEVPASPTNDPAQFLFDAESTSSSLYRRSAQDDSDRDEMQSARFTSSPVPDSPRSHQQDYDMSLLLELVAPVNGPMPDFKTFITKLMKRTDLSASTLALAVLFVARIAAKWCPPSVSFVPSYPARRGNSTASRDLPILFPGAPGTAHRIAFLAIMVASKIVYDDTYDNRAWCTVSHSLFARPADISRAERGFLGGGLLGFDGIHVKRGDWSRFLDGVDKCIGRLRLVGSNAGKVGGSGWRSEPVIEAVGGGAGVFFERPPTVGDGEAEVPESVRVWLNQQQRRRRGVSAATAVPTVTHPLAPLVFALIHDDSGSLLTASLTLAKKVCAESRRAPARIDDTDDEEDIEFEDDADRDEEPLSAEQCRREHSAITAAAIAGALCSVDDDEESVRTTVWRKGSSVCQLIRDKEARRQRKALAAREEEEEGVMVVVGEQDEDVAASTWVLLASPPAPARVPPPSSTSQQPQPTRAVGSEPSAPSASSTLTAALTGFANAALAVASSATATAAAAAAPPNSNHHHQHHHQTRPQTARPPSYPGAPDPMSIFTTFVPPASVTAIERWVSWRGSSSSNSSGVGGVDGHGGSSGDDGDGGARRRRRVRTVEVM
ncbi:hypothetical protein DFJ73DRAFT_762679 [Zopfochytrium polystomum]|nr:hypothetical protein DFJ73DRAFT_762679 [Zopfochytrium polystomum]